MTLGDTLRIEIEKIIAEIYQAMGFPEPKIVWASSPRAALMIATAAYCLPQWHPSLEALPEAFAPYKESIAALRDIRPIAPLEGRLCILPGIREEAERRAVGYAWHETAWMKFGEVYCYVIPDEQVQISRIMHALVPRLCGLKREVQEVLLACPILPFPYSSAYDVVYQESVCGLPVWERYTREKVAAAAQAVEQFKEELRKVHEATSWIVWGEQFCVLAPPATHLSFDEHRNLHNEHGPALAFPDFELYAIHGVIVPAKVVLNPESISLNDIFTEPNQTRRTIMASRVPLEKLMNHATAIDKSEEGTLWDFSYPSGRIRFVSVICPSTGKTYLLKVHPGIRTVKKAIAWTFGKEEDEYHPIVET